MATPRLIVGVLVVCCLMLASADGGAQVNCQPPTGIVAKSAAQTQSPAILRQLVATL